MNNKSKLNWSVTKALSVAFTGLMLASTHAWADVSGTVYRDLPVNGTALNTYGVQDANELGVAGITVTVTDSSGAVVGTPATTDANGNWTVAGTSGDVRIEFSNIPSYLESSPVNTGSNTTVQFINDGDAADLGLHDPIDYSQPDPDIILPLHINGDPNGGGTAEPEPGLILHAYNVANGSSGANVNISTTGETGATYGIAYQRDTGSVFSAAFLKRHVGLENSLGSIFITTNLYGTPNTTEYVDLSALLGNFGTLPARPDVPANTTDPSIDAGVYAEVGKLGLGDLDISADGSKLYTVNLAAKSLLTINIGNPAKAAGSLSASDITETTIPSPMCTNGEWRPFGLGVGSGKVFVGGVCDASTGSVSDLTGHIFTYDLATSGFDADSVLDFSLGFARKPVNVNNPQCDSWKPWSGDFADAENYEGNKYCLPQPIFTDIVLESDGSLVLGFRDRFGDQFGHNNYAPDGSGLYQAQANGDLYRAGNNNGSFSFESNAVAGNLTGCGAGNSDGPGGGEFYCEDGIYTHPNSSMGGAALLSGSGEVAISLMDPVNLWSGGTRWLNNASGQNNKDYEVFNTGPSGIATFGKANGIGDLEFISLPATIEIGNRVWDDVNSNGIQDAGEAGIDGVTVTLNCGGANFTQTTANGGQYLFTDNNVTGGIPRDTDCTITVPTDVNGQTLTTQTATTDETLGSNPDVTSGSFTFRTGFAGQNNHTYDIGYRNAPATTGNLSITKDVTGGTDTQNFSIQLDCSDDAFDDNSISLADGATHTVNNIPTGTTWTVTETTPTPPSGYSYGTPVITPAQPITIGDGTTVAVNVENPLTQGCLINPPTVNAVCNDAGTPTDPNDDRFSYSIAATSVAGGSTYSISGDDTQANLAYNSTHTNLGDFPISGGNLTLTLTDDTDNSCLLNNVTVTAPATCSDQTAVCTTVVNTVSITASTETDTDSSNDTDSASVQVNCTVSQPDLRLVKRADKTQVIAGELVVFTIELTNEGAGDATDIQVEDQLPAGLSHVSNNPQQGTYNPLTGIWDVGDLPAGQTLTLEITVSVD